MAMLNNQMVYGYGSKLGAQILGWWTNKNGRSPICGSPGDVILTRLETNIFPGPTHNDSNEEIGIQTFGSSQRTRQAWSNWQGESHWVTYRNLDIQ